MKRVYFLILIVLLGCTMAKPGSFMTETEQKKKRGGIVFCQHDGEYWQIWIMDLDGSNKKQLTVSKIDKRSPDFSSDGQKIAYVTNDGKLWKMDNEGNNNTAIPLNISASEPKWCFNDKEIVFTSYRGIYFLDDSDIWIVNNDGSNLRKIVRRPSIQFLPEVSRDGREMLFVDVLEISSHEIFKLNLETKDYVQLTENYFHDTTPVFTNDAGQIIYSSDENGNYDIWIMDKFGQNQKNLTKNPAFDSLPVVTEDGNTIFFLSDRTGSMHIWSMDAKGRELKQMTNDNSDKQDISIYRP